MTDNLKTMAMIDVAEHLLKENKEPMEIQELVQKVRDIKDLEVDDIDRLTQLYMDITQSAKFVYCGEDKWDLKERNLELWDKDGYAFITVDDEEEDAEEDLDFTDFVLEDVEEEKAKVSEDEDEVEAKDEEEEKELKEEKKYIEVELPIKSTDDDDGDDDIDLANDYDEDNYNEIMDDYEDMYDDE